MVSDFVAFRDRRLPSVQPLLDSRRLYIERRFYAFLPQHREPLHRSGSPANHQSSGLPRRVFHSATRSDCRAWSLPRSRVPVPRPMMLLLRQPGQNQQTRAFSFLSTLLQLKMSSASQPMIRLRVRLWLEAAGAQHFPHEPGQIVRTGHTDSLKSCRRGARYSRLGVFKSNASADAQLLTNQQVRRGIGLVVRDLFSKYACIETVRNARLMKQRLDVGMVGTGHQARLSNL